MASRLDGKQIQPSDLTPQVYEGFSIVENMVLASSNLLRSYLALPDHALLSPPIPKVVTRKNPSLDNYFADLLLRSCFAPVDYLPAYEEHVIRGDQVKLPSNLNPRLVGSILIGIGGQSDNPDFVKVYDEHIGSGMRHMNSASEVVFQEHIAAFSDNPGVAAIQPILEEINAVDAEGGAGGDHLRTRELHVAQFRQPGFVAEPLDDQWKRAILEAILAAISVSARAFEEGFDNDKALQSLEREWNSYIQKAQRLQEGGFVDPVQPSVSEYVKSRILRSAILEIKGKPSYFTPRRILYALERVWHPQVVSFIMGFLFEAKLQSQASFEEMVQRKLQVARLPDRFALVYYQKEPRDKTPHSAILAQMNNARLKALVIVHDPFRQITSVFRNSYMPYETWRAFCDLLIAKEGEAWYILTHENGEIANFALNGTESFLGVPVTKLGREEFRELLANAVTTPGQPPP